jgi:hypothetical protein
MTLEQFVNQKVTVRYRNNSVATGTLLRYEQSQDYPYLFDDRTFSKRGEFCIDKLDYYDIVSIQPTEELKMTEINYKELAEELYDAIKDPYSVKTERQTELMQKYERLHKPKITFTGYNNVERYVYNNRDYALLGGFWYRCQNNILTYVEDGDLEEDLFLALIEYEKTK